MELCWDAAAHGLVAVAAALSWDFEVWCGMGVERMDWIESTRRAHYGWLRAREPPQAEIKPDQMIPSRP